MYDRKYVMYGTFYVVHSMYNMYILQVKLLYEPRKNRYLVEGLLTPSDKITVPKSLDTTIGR